MATVAPTALAVEIAYFEKHKQELIDGHCGKFVVICGDNFLDAYDTFENAYNAGVKAYGDRQFLVRKVLRSEPDLTNLALLHGLIDAHL